MIEGKNIANSTILFDALLLGDGISTLNSIGYDALLLGDGISTLNSIGYDALLLGDGISTLNSIGYDALLLGDGISTLNSIAYDALLFGDGISILNSIFLKYILDKQIFGVNTIETVDSIIVNKKDLTFLTPSLNNGGQQLFVALLLQVVENWKYSSLTDSFNIFYWKTVLENSQRKNSFVLNHYSKDT